MKLTVKNFDGSAAGDIELNDAVFGAPVRQDLLQRAVTWQLANRRSGTHKAKTRGEIKATSKKMWAQKGGGRARHGNEAAPQFRGGGKAFGPVLRSHVVDLPKKVRKLALRTALSAKQAQGKLMVIDGLAIDAPKTAALAKSLAGLGVVNALVIGGETLDRNFELAARNIAHLDVLPEQGANVYDILRRDTLVLSREAVQRLEERLK
jgi:large subunit ribosomal protein L4